MAAIRIAPPNLASTKQINRHPETNWRPKHDFLTVGHVDDGVGEQSDGVEDEAEEHCDEEKEETGA